MLDKTYLCILDLDGTLYSSNICKTIDKRINLFLKRKGILTHENMSQIEQKEPDVIKLIKKYGVCCEEFYSYVYDSKRLKYDKTIGINRNVLKEYMQLISHYCLCFIVSNSPYFHINRIVDLLGIGDFIEEAISVNEKNGGCKKNVYSFLMDKYKIPAKRIYVLGNNYMVDLAPARELGCQEILVSDSKNDKCKRFKDIYDALNYLLISRMENTHEKIFFKSGNNEY